MSLNFVFFTDSVSELYGQRLYVTFVAESDLRKKILKVDIKLSVTSYRSVKLC